MAETLYLGSRDLKTCFGTLTIENLTRLHYFPSYRIWKVKKNYSVHKSDPNPVHQTYRELNGELHVLGSDSLTE
jgi:hypothetical protein